MREPTRRPLVSGPGWNERAAVALLVLVAGHLLAAEPASVARPLTPDRLAHFVAAHDLPALVAVCAGSPSEQVRHGAHQLRRLLRAGQAQVYQRVLPGLSVALADPYFRLALARAAARACHFGGLLAVFFGSHLAPLLPLKRNKGTGLWFASTLQVHGAGARRQRVRPVLRVRREDVLDGHAEEAGDLEGQRQAGVVLARFQRVDRLPRNA